MGLMKSFVLYLMSVLIIRGALSYTRVCYYTNWSQFAPTNNRFLPNRIPPQLCTHIVFAYADIRATNVTPTEFNDIEMYGRLNRLKRDRPSLQVILAIGGWAAGGERFSRLVSSENSVAQFTNNLIIYLRRYGLDGVNIDWQYPTATDRGSDVVDRIRFTRLLQFLRRAFNEEATATGQTRLSLTAALETDIGDARNYYQIEDIGRVLDFGFLMAYDMYGQWDPSAGARHHSALEPEIRTFVQGWVEAGFPSDKLVLGVSGFGRSFTLASEPAGTGLGQAVSGGGVPGPLSRDPGLLDYGEICANIERQGWTRIWLENRGVPIAYGNSSEGWQWVGYDDPQSMAVKAAFIRQEGLAGVMFWSLEHDDFNNVCSNGSWPLLRTLARELPFDSSETLPQVPPSSSPAPPRRPPSPVPATPTTTRTTTRAPLTTSPSARRNAAPRQSSTSTTTTTSPSLLFHNSDSDSFPFAPTSGVGSQTTTPLIRSVAEETETEVEKEAEVDWEKSIEEEEEKGLESRNDTESKHEYRQCKMADLYGPSLSCPKTRGKPGVADSFYLYCFSGFFAIECQCLPGYFFSRCLQTCDVNSNFRKCPIVH